MGAATSAINSRIDAYKQAYLPLAPDDDDELVLHYASDDGGGALSNSRFGLLPFEMIEEIAAQLSLADVCAPP